VQGAIDGIHIFIVKPFAYFENYYHHKFGGYSVVVEALIDCKKKVIDVFVGLLGSVNGSRVLCKSAIYRNAHYHGLFASNNLTSQHGFSPYLLDVKGYPLITWYDSFQERTTYNFGNDV